MSDSEAPAGSLRIGYPPGLSPDKWLRRMAVRFPGVHLEPTLVDVGRAQLSGAPSLLASGSDSGPGFDVVFVRESSDAPRSAPPGLARIPLYDEAQAVLVPRDHEASLFSNLALSELEGERWIDPVDPLRASSADVEMHIELVAANVGLGRLPVPLARTYSRKDVVVVPLDEPPATRMGVAWLPERGDEDAIAGFVGIVQGRTERTSRGPEPEARPTSKGASKSKGAAASAAKSGTKARTPGDGGARRSGGAGHKVRPANTRRKNTGRGKRR